VGVPDPHRRVDQYPHQLSGGMRQRAMIAMALAGKPKLLIADEPTTALDVTVQAQILDLVRNLTEVAIVWVSHDLGVVAGLADRVLVMYAGYIIEEGDVRQVFHNPRHPYTRGLLKSVPSFRNPDRSPLAAIPGLPPTSPICPPVVRSTGAARCARRGACRSYRRWHRSVVVSAPRAGSPRLPPR
jgi:oligopeptide/dipeptide ABC transporter ATP-binding protein